MRNPDFKMNVDLLAFFYNEFGACGCSELDEMINTVIKILAWAEADPDDKPLYSTLIKDDLGAFYIIAGILDKLEFIEHGTSIRFSWITEKGKEFLDSLRNKNINDIENAEGYAYDDCYYGA